MILSGGYPMVVLSLFNGNYGRFVLSPKSKRVETVYKS